MSTSEGSATKPSVKVPLTTLALVCLIFALTSLVALVVVVSVKDVDVLSTVALSLAILAFVVQLIVYIVQAAQVAEQNRQSSALHEQMMSVLAQLQERTHGTQKSVDQMNVRLLEAVIGKTKVSGVSVDSPAFATQVVEAMASAGVVQEQPNPSSVRRAKSTRSTSEQNYPSPLDAAEAAAIHAEMSSPLSAAEAEVAQTLLQELDAPDRYSVGRFAADVLRFTAPDSFFGPGTSSSSESLIDSGLIEKIPGWKLYTLTPDGRIAGRLFTSGVMPNVTNPTLMSVRESYDEMLHRQDEERKNRED